jgi:ribosomal protein S18 acetylase RimI-like enzyme
MTLVVQQEPEVSFVEVVQLFDSSNFPDEQTRFSELQVEKMLFNSNLIVTARLETRLIGIAVSMSNFVSVCFLVLFAVDPDNQRSGIGRRLIDETRKIVGGDKVSFVTVSTPGAVEFYEKIGLNRCINAFIAPRRR